jgi:hypothetical protein
MTVDITPWIETFRAVVDRKHVKKIFEVAEREPLVKGTFPHCTNDDNLEYIYEPVEWWTSGFFPGSLWALCEMAERRDVGLAYNKLEALARKWSDQLVPMQYNTDTHDIGFLMMPSFQRIYDKYHDPVVGDIIIEAAKSLMTRWNENVQCFRSWNHAITKCYQFDSEDREFVVIIDNMMNLDLLYSASLISGDPIYADHATKHAETSLKYHVREDNSTYHVVIYDPITGNRKVGLTAQGYQHESAWSRGQAWALYGYATVYKYTRNPVFLEAAKKLADYFMSRVEDGVVFWDFDAPRPCVWDTSAAMIASSGMLLICELEGSQQYLPQVASLLSTCLNGALSSEDPNSDTILCHSTVNNYEYAKERIADRGLVYADYYFIEVGNRLINMGLV